MHVYVDLATKNYVFLCQNCIGKSTVPPQVNIANPLPVLLSRNEVEIDGVGINRRQKCGLCRRFHDIEPLRHQSGYVAPVVERVAPLSQIVRKVLSHV